MEITRKKTMGCAPDRTRIPLWPPRPTSILQVDDPPSVRTPILPCTTSEEGATVAPRLPTSTTYGMPLTCRRAALTSVVDTGGQRWYSGS